MLGQRVNGEGEGVDFAKVGAQPGQPVDRWHRAVTATFRGIFFGRVPVRGAPAPELREQPLLVVASHRNGAIDGAQVCAAYPRAQFLVSIQLLRKAGARALFSGIPVVRAQDIARYGLARDDVSNPVDAACAHLRARGELVIFPEGSSEWGFRPLPYKKGAARILCALIEEGIEPAVVPLGLFYSAPETFRSRAEVVRGKPVHLPPRGQRSRVAWEADVATLLAESLDAVSVKCPDQQTFDRVQSAAAARARGGESFAEAFLELQAEAKHGASMPIAPGPPAWPRALGLALMWMFAPILLGAALAGSKGDARNVVAFFKQLGGLTAALVWLPALAIAAFWWPPWIAAGSLSGLAGWLLLGVPRWRL